MSRTSFAFAALAFALAGCAAETTTEPTEGSEKPAAVDQNPAAVADGKVAPELYTKGGWYCFPWEDVYCVGIPPVCRCVPHTDPPTKVGAVSGVVNTAQ